MDPASEEHQARLSGVLTRRCLLATTGAMGLLALAPPARVGALLFEARAASARGRFLTAAEVMTLTALCDRLIPGPPEDTTPGAVQAGVPGAIDLLLGAFELDPPLIYAGGPFSDRAGSKRDDFAQFVQLDRQQELAWRIRLEGSRGLREREFAGPVKGLQEIYREGLALLDERAREAAGVDYAQASTTVAGADPRQPGGQGCSRSWGRRWRTRWRRCMGLPEYGGNRNRSAGRRMTGREINSRVARRALKSRSPTPVRRRRMP